MNIQLGENPLFISAANVQKVKGGIIMAVKKMTRSEAGRKGGQTTMKKYGSEFYQRIGRVGGKRGGNTTKERYGIGFYRTIGKKGGMK